MDALQQAKPDPAAAPRIHLMACFESKCLTSKNW